MLLPDKLLIVFDVETTDKHVAMAAGSVPEMIEIGAVKVTDQLEIVEEYRSMVQPLNMDGMTENVFAISGLRTSDVKDAPLWKDQWEKFAEFTQFKKIRLAAWSTWFDMPVLSRAYSRARLGFPHGESPVDLPSIVYAYAAMRGGTFPGFGLTAVCNSLGIERKTKHRALADAHDAVRVLKAMSDHDEDDEPVKLIAV